MTWTPCLLRAYQATAGTAASVLPSPVCISAMLPRASANAPRSCTSNMCRPRTRTAATDVMASTSRRSVARRLADRRSSSFSSASSARRPAASVNAGGDNILGRRDPFHHGFHGTGIVHVGIMHLEYLIQVFIPIELGVLESLGDVMNTGAEGGEDGASTVPAKQVVVA